ncbi:10560_t:CDS:1 [Diversispora eburnea]|uniref:10560_t:CDS:1 n=1 Tax=Diversispora eburnea TaxID=1213867 RepID=A0A9N9FDL7_9GLOM|nr:10560_t:CDS:1 [Diversispora eburnea]
MNQKITFSTILVALTLFFVCFSNAAPIELSPRVVGQLVYADFIKLSGRVTVYEYKTGTVRFWGQFNTGITNPNGKYELVVSGPPASTIPPQVIPQSLIKPPGTAAFQWDYNKGIEAFAGKTLSVRFTSVSNVVTILETIAFVQIG